ncbi:hypothetical protein EMCRGX_G020550 [Ephydatia muelleri]|eukprot:Em0016g520a
MGIKGLSSFVDNFFSGWVKQSVSGHLVFDGYSLCYTLHDALDWTAGGQYPEYHAIVSHFLRKLLSAGIQPIVVFDGVCEEEKYEVFIQRKQDVINRIHTAMVDGDRASLVLPLLAVQVFMTALDENGIPFHVVDGEADAAIVQIANRYACPVVSNDSDFYIFNIAGGFIPTNRFHWNADPVAADVYHVKAFCQQFKLGDEDLMLLIPSIEGNDFLPTLHTNTFEEYLVSGLPVHVGRYHRLLSVVRFAAQQASLERYLDDLQASPAHSRVNKEAVKTNCTHSKEHYKVPQISHLDEILASTTLRGSNQDEVPEWVLKRFRTGQLPAYLLQVLTGGLCMLQPVLDNSRLESAAVASRPLRQYAYSMLAPDPATTEMLRRGLKYEGERVPRVDAVADQLLPDLSSIPSMSQSDRWQLLCAMLSCKPTSLEGVDDDWKLPMGATRHWIASTSSPPYLVKALMACFVLCSSNQEELTGIRKYSTIPEEFRRGPKWVAAVHAYSQWQCTYMAALGLNQLLAEPVPATSLSRLYDGRVVLHLVSCRSVDSRIAGLNINQSLYSALMATIPQPPPKNASSSHNDKEPAKSKGSITSATSRTPAKQKDKSKAPTYLSANRFALLDDEGNSSGSDSS